MEEFRTDKFVLGFWQDFGRILADLGEVLGGVGRMLAEVGRMLAEVGRMLAEVGRMLADVGRSWQEMVGWASLPRHRPPSGGGGPQHRDDPGEGGERSKEHPVVFASIDGRTMGDSGKSTGKADGLHVRTVSSF